MLTPVLSAVLGAALGTAPASTANLSPSSTALHVLGVCQTNPVYRSDGRVLPNNGTDVSPMTDVELYLYHYTSAAFREAHDVSDSLSHPKQAKVDMLVPPKYGRLLDQGDPASGEWYRQGFEGKHYYRYVPNKGHETDSDRFTVRVTMKSVQVDIQYHIEAMSGEERADDYCPREMWKISQIDVKDLHGIALASTTFTAATPFQSASLMGATSGASGINVGFSSLSGPVAGEESASGVGVSITLDTDAAGHGWFVDSTPTDNSEFLPTANPNEWVAKVGSAAYGKMDMCRAPCGPISHRVWRLGAARDAMKQLHRLLEGPSCV